MLNVSELANTAGLSRPTVEKYLFILEQTYVIQLLRPFSRNIRSELFKTPKIFFHDTGIANLLALKGFPRTITGGMLENAVFSEFRKARDVGEFFYWRTQDGKEIDFIVPRGDYLVPVEVKKTGLRVRSTALRYFHKTYGPPRMVYMSLKKGGDSAGVETRYPWEGI